MPIFSHYLITIMQRRVHIKILSGTENMLLQFYSTNCLAMLQKRPQDCVFTVNPDLAGKLRWFKY